MLGKGCQVIFFMNIIYSIHQIHKYDDKSGEKNKMGRKK